MFDEWVETQLVYQHSSFGLDLRRMSETDRLRYIDDMLRAAMLEIAEAYQEFSWKSWAKEQFRNQDALTSELVDVLFFIANALAANGVTSEQLTAKYRSKMGLNTARQVAGYNGVLDKCQKCKRALDDTAVTCTSEFCSEDIPA